MNVVSCFLFVSRGMPEVRRSVQCCMSVRSVSHVVEVVVAGGGNDLASRRDDFSDEQHDAHHRFVGCDASALGLPSACQELFGAESRLPGDGKKMTHVAMDVATTVPLKPKQNETSHKSEIEQVERNRGMHVEIGFAQRKSQISGTDDHTHGSRNCSGTAQDPLCFAFARHRQELTPKSYLLRHRLHFFDALVTPATMCGAATWATTTAVIRRI